MANVIDRIQQAVGAWSRKNFGTDDPVHPLLGLQEEVGELSHAVLKRRQGIRMNEDHDAQEIDAIGDIFIYLCDYCNLNGLNFSKCVRETWEKVEQRDWTGNPSDETTGGVDNSYRPARGGREGRR